MYQSTLTFNLTGVQPGGFGPTFTRGNPGAGDVTIGSNDRVVVDIGHTPALTYRHNGPTWKAYVGLGYSNAANIIFHSSRGMFNNTTARRTGLTLSYDDISYLRPGTITVRDGTTGAPVDPYALESYQIATAGYHPFDALPGELNRVVNVQRGVQANLSRDFYGRVPFTLKGGLDVRENVRDLRLGGQALYTYVGADGRPLTADDRADVVRYDDAAVRSLPGFGFPRVQWMSNTKLFDLFRSRPTHFTIDDAATHRAATNVSKRAAEVISAAFVRGDLHLLNRRLNLVTGVRAEQTNLKAEGPLSDPTLNYQRDARGAVILSNGRPVPITSDPLRLAQLTVVDRGMHVNKEYLRFFPSVNASFNVRENLIARAAWYVSIGRPDFNQYAGGVTLPDTESLNPSTQRITVNNAAIKPWSARSTKLMLEYYFEKVGLLSVGVFRREIENFFGSIVFDSTPEFLA
ncbi:MAG: hypothetical protein EXS37_14620, partial [Opitutus sp.]|nr:hypothetical protein [Opitutus sp.]